MIYNTCTRYFNKLIFPIDLFISISEEANLIGRMYSIWFDALFFLLVELFEGPCGKEGGRDIESGLKGCRIIFVLLYVSVIFQTNSSFQSKILCIQTTIVECETVE